MGPASCKHLLCGILPCGSVTALCGARTEAAELGANDLPQAGRTAGPPQPLKGRGLGRLSWGGGVINYCPARALSTPSPWLSGEGSVEVAGGDWSLLSLPIWLSGATRKDGRTGWEKGLWSWLPEAPCPPSLTVLPLAGSKPKQGRECEGPRELGWPGFPRRDRV